MFIGVNHPVHGHGLPLLTARDLYEPDTAAERARRIEKHAERVMREAPPHTWRDDVTTTKVFGRRVSVVYRCGGYRWRVCAWPRRVHSVGPFHSRAAAVKDAALTMAKEKGLVA